MPSLHMFFDTHTHHSNLAFPKDLAAAALFACFVLPAPTNSSSVVFAMPESNARMDEQYEETRRLNAQDPVLENYQKNRESDRLDARLDAM
jgi:hypothetical protein